jgi:hypothetical protein
MTMEELKEAVDILSHEEQQHLQDYINQKQSQAMDIDALFQALDEIRAGFSDKEFAELERDMNFEYIEPLDKGERNG